MLASLKWLKDYVEIDIGMKELNDRLTMSGTKVEKIEDMGSEINNVVLGKILEINEHPKADRLVVTKVDIGNEEIQIVTGADNISVNDHIPVAIIGSSLPGGMKIKKSKLRGVESQGMMCSAQELGISLEGLSEGEINGIYIVKKPYPLGTDIKEILRLNDTLIEFEITNNRSDCLSMIGLARELAATLDKELKLPIIKLETQGENIKQYLDVEVIDSQLCPRYMTRVVENIKIEPSPKWMQDRLLKVGVRPINNIVDITNYVMLEMGQPLHAFDYNKISEKKIKVRKAKEGEKIITLDGVTRSLNSSMLVIADAIKPIAVAGVMGGINSEVDENTTTIVLESANFLSNSVRLTAKELGLRTEASNRFEKGIDQNLAELAVNRAAQLLEETANARVLEESIDHYLNPIKPWYIDLDPKWINTFIGIHISSKQMAEYLEKLGMEVAINETLKVKIPTFRLDLKLPEDLAEEIARLYGYDKIPSTVMSGVVVQGKRTYAQGLEDKIKKVLVGIGGYETSTYSFNSPQMLEQLNITTEDLRNKAIKIINPLGEENSIMRTTLVGNMLQVIRHNINRNVEKALFFELGKAYYPLKISENNLPKEVQNLCIGMYGNVDFFHMKGIVENILDICGIQKYEFRETKDPIFHPGRTAEVIINEKVIGLLGEVHPDVEENFDINERVYVAELDFDLIIEKSNLKRRYKDLPKYPSVTRDIALVIKESIPAGNIEKIIEKQKSNIIESYELFDIYQGEQIPEGYKSLAYSIVYRKNNGTLTDKEVSNIHNAILKDLKEELKAELRD